ncbi:MAG: hypothetical protein AB1635_15635 [Acidobacteriota bacterium]
MIDREKVITVLRKRFPGASDDQIAAAANAIVGLGEEWHEVVGFERDLQRHASDHACDEPDCFVERLRSGRRFRLLEKLDE